MKFILPILNIFLLLIIPHLSTAFAQAPLTPIKTNEQLPTVQTNEYQYTIDLKNIIDDKVSVSLITPKINDNSTIFYFPKMVPGTYAIYDFGRYIDDFKAFDKNKKELSIERLDTNSWQIKNAKELYSVSYKVNDSFDYFTDPNPIFEPAGSNIQADTNFVLNTHCFLGYLKQLQKVPYNIYVTRKENLYGSTVLNDLLPKSDLDLFKTASYNEIVDSPIMYHKADTATVKVGATNVLISVYSAGGNINASYIAKEIDKLLQAQGKYLGGTLPVNKYAFIFYFDKKVGVSGKNGALEHATSSVYYLPDIPKEFIITFLLDVCAHEFFHILTPLTLQSYEIADFDFNNPKMSKHLWLYEGTTEYHANIVQKRYGFNTEKQFLAKTLAKIKNMYEQFNDTLPFTTMSTGVLDKYIDEYGNVYEKGAIIAMCLDIMLRKNTNGNYGVVNLVQDLGKKYGINKPFNDDDLFNDIEKLSTPEIKSFLEKYVSGNKPLPLKEIFEEVGLTFEKGGTEKTFSNFGVGKFNIDKKNKKLTVKLIADDKLGNDLKYQVNDVIESINGTKVNADNILEYSEKWHKTVKNGDKISITVLRKNNKGKEKKIKLQANVFEEIKNAEMKLEVNEKATPKQLQLQKLWWEAN